jgi:SAM-dependent methyltransferase
MDTKAIGKILGSRFEEVAEDGARAVRELRLLPDAAILDVGTGKGNFAIYLASQGYRVLTGEPDDDRSQYAGRDWALSAAKAGVLDRIRFEAFDASRLPFEPGAFDAVFFFGVLHHIDEDIRGEVFREALRVSKQNGAVVFFEPRQEMLERVRVDDPEHPPAANPSEYLTDLAVRERRIEGAWMDIFIYRKSEAAGVRSEINCGIGVKTAGRTYAPGRFCRDGLAYRFGMYFDMRSWKTAGSVTLVRSSSTSTLCS